MVDGKQICITKWIHRYLRSFQCNNIILVTLVAHRNLSAREKSSCCFHMSNLIILSKVPNKSKWRKEPATSAKLFV